MKKIAQKLLYQGKWLSLQELIYQDKNKNQHSWETIERKNKVCTFCILAQLKPSNRYVLIKQFRQAINNYILGLPAGLGPDKPLTTKEFKKFILKELKEETGYTGKINSISPLLKTNSGIMNSDFYFVTAEIDELAPANKSPQPQLELEEDINVVLKKPEKIKDFLISQKKKGIDIGSGLWFIFGYNFKEKSQKILKYAIEKANIKNAKEILKLQKIAYLTEAERYNNFCIDPLKETLEKIEADIKNQIVLKATLNNKIIGSVRAYAKEKETCFIGRLFVHPDFRGRGIAKALMAKIEKHFNYVKRYELFTGWKSSGNISLYMSIGYYPYDIENFSAQDKIIFMEKINV